MKGERLSQGDSEFVESSPVHSYVSRLLSRALRYLSPFTLHLSLFLVSFQLQANPIEFTEADAHVALAAASNLVERCTPRDAGTVRGRLAAEWILDRVSRTGADATLDKFRAPTPDGERTFANVTVEFPGTKTNAAWIVVMSHFDTMPGIGDGFQGANDGASTSGLLVAMTAALRRAGRQRIDDKHGTRAQTPRDRGNDLDGFDARYTEHAGAEGTDGTRILRQQFRKRLS